MEDREKLCVVDTDLPALLTIGGRQAQQRLDRLPIVAAGC